MVEINLRIDNSANNAPAMQAQETLDRGSVAHPAWLEHRCGLVPMPPSPGRSLSVESHKSCWTGNRPLQEVRGKDGSTDFFMLL